MKYCRFLEPEGIYFGRILESQEMVAPMDPPPEMHWALRLKGPRSLSGLKLIHPVRPSKIVCVGRNYPEHARELGNPIPKEPLIFLKPPSSLIATGEVIRRPALAERLDYEGEVAVVMARTCRKLRDDEDARSYIRGYTCLNDVTARNLQSVDGQWTRAKGFDTFCPVGPVVSDDVDAWQGIQMQTRVNGELRQQGNTREFLFPLDAIIRYISRVMTLFPGDLIATGTPPGVGPLKAGDLVEVEVEGVGTLSNRVRDE